MQHGGHAATGAATGTTTAAAWLLLAQPDLHPARSIAVVAVAGLYVAGWALGNDIDHDKSFVTKSGGPFTRVIAEVLQWLARHVYRWTRKDCDKPGSGKNGEHRGLLHTWPGALTIALALAIGSTYTPWVARIASVLILSAAIRSLAYSLNLHRNKRTRDLTTRWGALTAAIILTATWDGTALLPTGPALGVLAFVGMLTHNAGDGATAYGVPWKFFFPHWCDRCRGKVNAARCGSWFQRAPWHFLRCGQCKQARDRPKCARWDRSNNTPAFLRFTTGAGVERLITVTSLVTAGTITIAAPLAMS